MAAGASDAGQYATTVICTSLYSKGAVAENTGRCRTKKRTITAVAGAAQSGLKPVNIK